MDVCWVAWARAGSESPGKQEHYLGHRSVHVDGQGLSQCFTTGAEKTVGEASLCRHQLWLWQLQDAVWGFVGNPAEILIYMPGGEERDQKVNSRSGQGSGLSYLFSCLCCHCLNLQLKKLCHVNSVVLVQRQTNRSLEQNRKFRNEPTYTWMLGSTRDLVGRLGQHMDN